MSSALGSSGPEGSQGTKPCISRATLGPGDLACVDRGGRGNRN